MVSWPDGSANVALAGTTAQLTASVVRAEPIPLKPGATANVPVQITYLSGDSTTLNVQLAIAAYPAPPPAGLTMGPAQAQLPPVFFAIKLTPGSSPHEILDLGRSATVTLTASADTGTQPGTQVVYVSVSCGEFPQLNPQPVKVTFDVPPLPVSVSIKQQQPISIIAGQSAGVTLLVAEAGAPTLLKLGTPSTPSGVSVVLPAPPPWPGWQDRGIGIGGGGAPVAAPLVIAVSDSANPDGVPFQDDTISIPWTAYGNKAVGSVSPEIRVVRNSVGICSGSLTATGATGSACLALNEKGYWQYSGSIKNGDIFAGDYCLGMKLTDSQGNPLLYVWHSGTVGPGVWPFSNTDSWNDQGFDGKIAGLWPKIIAPANWHAVLKVSTDALDAVLESLGIAATVYYGATLLIALGYDAATAIAANCSGPIFGIAITNGGIDFTLHFE